jgi:membrane protease YdiL (CAAX protease family)
VQPLKSWVKTLGVALGVTAVVGAGALVVPKKYVATFVGLVFLGAVWRLVWTKDDAAVREHGVQLGGLLLHEPVVVPNVIREGARAAAWALGCAIVIFGPYYLGWRYWWHPHHAFSLDFKPIDFGNDVLGQLLLVALPEEAFYRGYLQTELDKALPPRLNVFGAKVGLGLLITSLVFAIGHFVTVPFPARLAVFFPSLVFGWLRTRTGGIGAALAFHAFCNVFSEILGRAYGVY